jgi:hypothetical protein
LLPSLPQVLDRLLVKLSQKGHRVVLFSQFSRMLDILEDYIHLRWAPSGSGSNGARRQQSMHRVN